MRPLTEDETKTLFEKLAKYIGRNITSLINRTDEPYCFRMHKSRIYYIPERIMRQAVAIPREQLCSLGTCFGKMTKTNKFRLHVTCLDHIAPYAQFKVWIKPAAELQFLYGNHVFKSGVGRMTENTPQYQGVIIYSMSDIPLGFGVTAKSTSECRRLDPTAIVVLHQCDLGEYLRSEDSQYL
eukprot:gnl/Hemi2/23594_TR7913_c0_g1_i1.p1 gnl/Hemi2/23594_TR7913_c0_g1~~gnl/Hemi2/23594_TR7913_c0_g1_i1.p1  ORF type:complete len:182 (+),score=42.18 gnl/Hemi2/23594_TR7913_c0_g1_i1:54-599(+)